MWVRKLLRLTEPAPFSTATVIGVPPEVELICTNAFEPDVPRVR